MLSQLPHHLSRQHQLLTIHNILNSPVADLQQVESSAQVATMGNQQSGPSVEEPIADLRQVKPSAQVTIMDHEQSQPSVEEPIADLQQIESSAQVTTMDG